MFPESYGVKDILPGFETPVSSRHANMKELRFDAADGVWRFAFAFDPKRREIVLCGGDKSGSSEKRFYRQLIDKADNRFHAHLVAVEQREGTRGRSKSRRRRS